VRREEGLDGIRFRLRRADGTEIDLGSPQQRTVLAAPLLRARTHVSAEELTQTLWPDDPPRTAVGTIRTCKILGDERLFRLGGG
jgi:DNA-binding SARP family transcriptional activator